MRILQEPRFAGDVSMMKDSVPCRIHHRTHKSSAYSLEILLPWQMIYFIFFSWSSCIISILLILGKYIKKVINWQLWLCYGPQTAIIHYISIINFTSNVFQQRLPKEKKSPHETWFPEFWEPMFYSDLMLLWFICLSQGCKNQNNSKKNLLLYLINNNHPHLIFIESFLFFFNLSSAFMGFPDGLVVKNPPANAGDTALITGSGIPSGEGNGNTLQYSYPENPMNRGAWWVMVQGVTKSWTQLRY